MTTSISDAMRKAFFERGEELPSKTRSNSQINKDAHLGATVSHGKIQANPKMESRLDLIQMQKRNPTLGRVGMSNSRQPQRHNANKPIAASSTQTIVAGVQGAQIQPKKQKLPSCELSVADGIKPVCLIQDEPDDYIYVAHAYIGVKDQAHTGKWIDERDVVIGLDFGTSSVKVIIGDKVLGKAFAVPFSEVEGIRRYLLPTRLYETDSSFFLTGESQLFRDLKLSLLADPGDAEVQLLATAFLALVIRHARGWLLSEHHDKYYQTNVLWKLVVGVPATHHLQDGNQKLFYQVAQAAWLAGARNQPTITRENVVNTLSRSCQLIAGETPQDIIEEAEISVVPEIAAQIYGYVASNRFDSGARNLYLMVDVGAGTIDSSLFQVKQGKGGRFDFSFYTSQVQPNGVMNLHRYRMQWWEKELESLKSHFIPELDGFIETRFVTDRMRSIPESYLHYFSGIHVQHSPGVEDPDQIFFKKHVVAQVRAQSMWITWRDNLLNQQDLNGVPMFICGGGSRMLFYRNLEQEMQNMPNCTWLTAESRPLEKPKILVAPGLPVKEYDRLSVAFGLSFLEVSEVVKATPIPQIVPDQVTTWRDNYVDKDQC